MGSSYSKTSNNNDWQIAEQKAAKLYNYRIKNYNPLIHGPRHYYMLQVEAEYELECIPEYMRSGGGSKW